MKMNTKIKEQIQTIRELNQTSLFDLDMVAEIANNLNFIELVKYLKYERAAYIRFILIGDKEE